LAEPDTDATEPTQTHPTPERPGGRLRAGLACALVLAMACWGVWIALNVYVKDRREVRPKDGTQLIYHMLSRLEPVRQAIRRSDNPPDEMEYVQPATARTRAVKAARDSIASYLFAPIRMTEGPGPALILADLHTDKRLKAYIQRENVRVLARAGPGVAILERPSPATPQRQGQPRSSEPEPGDPSQW